MTGLVWLLVAPVANATDVLLCYASPHNADVEQKLLATNRFAVVDVIDCRMTTPELAQLSTYDAVLIYTDYPFADPIRLGDTLADYVDGGGGVVEAMFATGLLPVGGRFDQAGYRAMAGTEARSGVRLNLRPDDPAHPILNGVASFDGGTGSWHAPDAALTAGAALVAHWDNGVPLVATLDTHPGLTVGLNFYPPSDAAQADFWDRSTDGVTLLANALEWAANVDSDLDGLVGFDDNCPYVPNPQQENADGDSRGDVCDNCVDVVNDSQRDRDEDGFGEDCDCSDTDAGDHPGADELCDGDDNDCDAEIDEDAVDAVPFFADTDGDGQGDPDVTVLGCEEGEGRVGNSEDCDDGSAEIRLGATEVCDDAVDNDCDGEIDPVAECPLPEGDDPEPVAEEGGCGCNQGPSGTWAVGLASLLVLRRRRG